MKKLYKVLIPLAIAGLSYGNVQAQDVKRVESKGLYGSLEKKVRKPTMQDTHHLIAEINQLPIYVGDTLLINANYVGIAYDGPQMLQFKGVLKNKQDRGLLESYILAEHADLDESIYDKGVRFKVRGTGYPQGTVLKLTFDHGNGWDEKRAIEFKDLQLHKPEY